MIRLIRETIAAVRFARVRREAERAWVEAHNHAVMMTRPDKDPWLRRAQAWETRSREAWAAYCAVAPPEDR